MVNLPGYTLRGALKPTGKNLLFLAVRDADGLALILKTPTASTPGPRESERYHREATILQRLRDVRGVTHLHAHERVHERPVLLLEPVEGTTLSELTGQPFEPTRVLTLAISLASTLAELHRRGVIHKDIKPSNVILTPTGEACLIDFGTATLRLVEHVEATPAPLLEGTLAYMSPEQTGRMNRSVDYRTDFYSLGVTLYELLTGSRPFHGRDALEWFHAHMALVPQPPVERVPGVPRALSAIVMKLLAKVAEERYQSADGLKADLAQCQADLLRGVDEDFPLGMSDSLEESRKAGARMTDLQIGPLSLEDLQQLIADTLPGAEGELVQPLSVLLQEKTGGNPFFVLQFMRTLHQDGLLARTPRGTWRWDEAGVRAKGYSEQVHERLFDVVSQLNAGAALINEPSERRRAARLNAEAGRRARASTAFRSAATYFAAAFQHLSDDPWETDFELAFEVRMEQASCEFISGNAAEARRLVEELRPRARTRPELAAVYRLKTQLHTVAHEGLEATTCLLECLEQMGMPMPLYPSWEEVEKANAQVWSLLGERPIASLIDLPFVNDPDQEALMSVLGALFEPVYFISPSLLVLHICRMVSLSLVHGNTAASVHGYAWYAVVMGPTFKKYREAQAFGQLACELVERHGLSASRGRALHARVMISCWTQPLSHGLHLAHEATQHALQSSDISTACYASHDLVTYRLALGHPLDEVYQESVARLDFVSKAGFLLVRDVLRFLQRHIQQLRGLAPSFGSLNGEDFDEASFEAGLGTAVSTTQCWYWLTKAQARFLSGAYAEALEAVNKSFELRWASLGQLPLLDLHLYRALSLAACHEGMTPEQRRSALDAIRGHQLQLAEWAGHNPSTFHAPERLVSAELARLMGRENEALHAYEQAFKSARQQGFTHQAALASELAARFWRMQQVDTLAEAYAREAREAWLRWGAHGKLQHLDSLWR
ncbi:hypothetical protein BON30_08275 [Cystobacter ferrugineus]|uniref:Protein kinase domain-containing protein n=1 Tax=Cystobacter ferrugineus TaxID=83449 RepID=A0A1L9BF76_9BACT|nr:serine/threonine-protein kinase [Cystobacter ferrugineus]OJH40909.1 hypothetical protein BON30_08275 [Cystobacter ferrugineus]